MEARKLIEGACYGPEQLKIMREAYDDAWEKIAPAIGKRDTIIKVARLGLANVILNIANNGVTDARQMADTALKRMLEPPVELDQLRPGTKT